MTDDPTRAARDAAASPDARERHGVVRHEADVEGHEHATPHLPPPSIIPINIAFALAVLFVGFLSDIRKVLGPAMWLIGLVWLIISCAAWVRAARREYLEIPEDASH